MRPVPILVCAAALAGSSPARAQFFERLFNPDVEVGILHPPGLGIAVTRVAFAPAADRAAEDLAGTCMARLLQQGGVEVLDRSQLDAVLRERRLSVSGLVDPGTAVELGRLLGAPVLMVVKVHRDEARETTSREVREGGKDKQGKELPPVVTHIARTQVEFIASVQAVDMATGRVFNLQRYTAAPSAEARLKDKRPDFPSATLLREQALGEVATQMVRLLVPWTERRKLIFYDDQDYGMKAAYRLLRSGDARGALERSREALAAAKANPRCEPKHLGRVHYNLGMCHFILGQRAEAQGYLKLARDLDAGNGIYQEALAECQRAEALAADVQQAVQRGEALSASPETPKAGSSLEDRLRRLDDLHRKGLITEEEYRAKRAELLKEL